MVKSYARFEHTVLFGVVSSGSNVVYVPLTGQAISAGLENILVWNIKTGDLVQKLTDGVDVGSSAAKTLTAPPTVTCLLYHWASGVAAGYSDGSVRLWDLASGTVQTVFSGHRTAVTQVVFNGTGTVLCSGSRDTTIILWDLVAETGMFKLKGHKDQITGLSFLSEKPASDELEDWLISTSKDGLVKLWDLKARACVETHVAHSGECWGFGYDAQSRIMVTLGMENQLKVWYVDLEGQLGLMLVEKGLYLKLSGAKAQAVEFINVGGNDFFLVQNLDKTVEVFRLRTANEVSKALARKARKLEEKGLEKEEIEAQVESGKTAMLIQAVALVRCGLKVKSAVWGKCTAKGLEILTAQSNNSMEYHHILLPSVTKKMTITSGEVNVERKYTIELLGHRTDVRSLDISNDDKLLLTALNGQLKIWNVRTRNCLRTIECGYAICSKFLPGDQLVVVGTRNGEIQLFDLASSEMICEISDAHSQAIWSLDITEDGKTLVTGSADKSVKFWDFRVESESVPGSSSAYSKLGLKHLKTLELAEDVLAVCISPDNKLLAVSLLDNTVKVFYFDTLKFFLSLYGHKLPVLSLDIAYDSKLIVTASADKNIKLWGLDFGDCHKSIFAHQDLVMNARFLPESHNFFTTSKDGVVKYWDGVKFECVQKLPAHYSEVWALGIAKSGLFVVTASHDHSIRIWEQTSDQVFPQEEKEKEIEELYEQTLLENLENDDIAPREDDENSVEAVNKQTTESLKDGEKIMEALDIGSKDLEDQAAYEKALEQHKNVGGLAPIKPEKNIILLAKNVDAIQYVLDVVRSVKASHLEDAILILPFSYSAKLLVFLNYWAAEKKYIQPNLALISRILFFIVQTHYKELVSARDPVTRENLRSVKVKLREELKGLSSTLAFNVQGLRYVRDQWKMKHSTEFVDEYEQELHERKMGEKRVFEKV